ncbi:H-type small acid-soluble spore protein [Lysinibacillus endophyticus]|uniref:H-type small acid-soluble spore protein n=1 Tax=Ureibacillus endophyticus TaxID=1978490 RepID=A0A494YSM1_9BACL|nr:H-type small acid-soluble spore protein [Lysinibacillus endophyticus]MCP1146546.1 H-type small acid-soluble spore protein [Lysinibacillus endophyticus]RKQ12902.1 H-type small acid-soluble spore protein [Lysinibacillus endophyticus]
MDFSRAQQIYSSPKEYEVSYNGVSIWIDKLHEDGKTATVHLRHSLEERSEVDVSELKEEYLIQ